MLCPERWSAQSCCPGVPLMGGAVRGKEHSFEIKPQMNHSPYHQIVVAFRLAALIILFPAREVGEG